MKSTQIYSADFFKICYNRKILFIDVLTWVNYSEKYKFNISDALAKFGKGKTSIVIYYPFEPFLPKNEFWSSTIEELFPALRKIIYVTGGAGLSVQLPAHIKTICFPEYFFTDAIRKNTFYKNYNSPTTKHFISLTRGIKAHRAFVTELLFEKQLLEFGLVSFRTDFKNSIYTPSNKEFAKLLPLVFDNDIADDSPTRWGTDLMATALVNLILETNIDSVNQQTFWPEHPVPYYTTDHFITEKTIKAFAMHQIPLLVSSVGTIKFLEDLGFDMFRDLFDLSYDNIVDPRSRCLAAVVELENFIKSTPTAKLPALRQRFKSRFEHNKNQVIKIGNAGYATLMSQASVSIMDDF